MLLLDNIQNKVSSLITTLTFFRDRGSSDRGPVPSAAVRLPKALPSPAPKTDRTEEIRLKGARLVGNPHPVPKSTAEWAGAKFDGVSAEGAVAVLCALLILANADPDKGYWVLLPSKRRARLFPGLTHKRLMATELLKCKEYSSTLRRAREYKPTQALLDEYARVMASAVPGNGVADLLTGVPLLPSEGDEGPVCFGADTGYFGAEAAKSHLDGIAADYECARADVNRRLKDVALSKGVPEDVARSNSLAIREVARLHDAFTADALAYGALCSRAVQPAADSQGAAIEGAWLYARTNALPRPRATLDADAWLDRASTGMWRAVWSAVPDVHVYTFVDFGLVLLYWRLMRDDIPCGNVQLLWHSGYGTTHAEQIGLAPMAWERAIIALAEGATLFKSSSTARDGQGAFRGEVPRLVMEGAHGDPAACYDAFADLLRPLYQDILAWRRELVRIHRSGHGHELIWLDMDEPPAPHELSDARLRREASRHIIRWLRDRYFQPYLDWQREGGYSVAAVRQNGIVTSGRIPAAYYLPFRKEMPDLSLKLEVRASDLES